MKTFALISSLLFPITVFCQIPNPGFENWAIVNDIEEPDSWETNNKPSPSYRSVTKTNDNYNGNYALQVINKGFTIEGFGPGYATTVFTINDLVNTVSAYVKCDSLEGTGKGQMYVYGYLNSDREQIGYWETGVLIPGYMFIEIPLDPVLDYDSIEIQIVGWAGSSSMGQTGFARLKVDQLNAEMVTGTKDLGAEGTLEVYPNPARDEVTLSFTDRLSEDAVFHLFNALGHKIRRFPISKGQMNYTISLGREQQGVYFYSIESKNLKFGFGKLIISK